MNTADPFPSNPLPRWQLKKNFLLERRKDGNRYWGRWDRKFGLWDSNGGVIIPEFPVLRRLGVWFDPEEEPINNWFVSRAALTAYWSIIPTAVRLEASRQDNKHQWLVLLGEWLARHLPDLTDDIAVSRRNPSLSNRQFCEKLKK